MSLYNHKIFSIAALFLCYLIAGCDSGESLDIAKSKDFKKISVLDDTVYNFNLSTIVDSLSYITLDSSKHAVVGTVNKIDRSDSLFFLMDAKITQSLLVYNNKGRLKYKLAVSNGLPLNFKSLTDFTLDHKRNFLYVFSNDDSKVFKYNSNNGKFISYFNVEGYFEKFEYMNDDTFLFFRDGFPTFNDTYDQNRVCLIDRHGRFKKGWLREPLNPVLSFGGLGTSNTKNSSLLVSRLHCDTLYRITASGGMESLYKLDLGERENRSELFNAKDAKSLSKMERESSYFINKIFENRKSILVRFAKGRYIHTCYIDKNKNVQARDISFVNDIDRIPFTSVEYLSDDIMVSVIKSSMIKEVSRLYRNKNDYSTYKKLQELNGKVSITSNPVLLICYLKK